MEKKTSPRHLLSHLLNPHKNTFVLLHLHGVGLAARDVHGEAVVIDGHLEAMGVEKGVTNDFVLFAKGRGQDGVLHDGDGVARLTMLDDQLGVGRHREGFHLHAHLRVQVEAFPLAQDRGPIVEENDMGWTKKK